MSSAVTRSSDHLSGPSSSTSGGGNTIVGVGGALSFMGCVREASPPPHDHCHTSVMEEDIDVRRDNALVKGLLIFNIILKIYRINNKKRIVFFFFIFFYIFTIFF